MLKKKKKNLKVSTEYRKLKKARLSGFDKELNTLSRNRNKMY